MFYCSHIHKTSNILKQHKGFNCLKTLHNLLQLFYALFMRIFMSSFFDWEFSTFRTFSGGECAHVPVIKIRHGELTCILMFLNYWRYFEFCSFDAEFINWFFDALIKPQYK